ncbi:PTS ascorbate transporter subunit IIC [Alkalicoccobacillus gibsonii]|uniref:PTS ascorbate transporter subunit IIC n=1 Tax=Alkalicoccobacillus gibsonii TaxID=79881 RepID=UPI0019348516|nr:PTS ascorbate transporter subunit IIC [Alkalicoccobacillus gibsonii]MBM0065497.1 PTS ascorbate transporter subunit IIC [Alkalicoccobacillus gibsonii]
MNTIFSIIIDVLSEPAVLVAIIALVGLIAQQKNMSDTLKGTVKTFVGFLVITAGAGVLSGSLAPFGAMFEAAFNVNGIVPNNEAIVALALAEYGSATALIMFFGMIVNIVIARFTSFKYIFLTGHITLYMSCMIAVILAVAGFTSFMQILLGAVTVGIFMSLSPAVVQPFVKRLTGNNNVALGHSGAVGFALGGVVGHLVKGKGEIKSTENINFPKGLGFLRDSTVSITLTMAILYVVVALFAGASFVESELSAGQNFILFSILQAGLFSAGVFVILAGVRLVLAEIVPAFKGISSKLVPNSKPALDVPIVFTYSPNAVLVGFFSSFAGGIVSMIVMIFAGGVIILPGVVPHFFTGAAAGVFGNATGGTRGAIWGAFANGVVISFMPIILIPVLGNLGTANATFSDSDFGVVGLFLSGLNNLGGQIAIMIGLALVLLVMVLFSFNRKKSIKS